MSRLRSGGERAAGGADGEDGGPRAHAARLAVRTETPSGTGPHARHAAALVDPRAAREQALAQAEHEPRRMHRRRRGHEDAAAGRPASRSARAPVPRSGRAPWCRRPPRPRRRRPAPAAVDTHQLAALAVPRVDALRLAPGPDRVHGLARGRHPRLGAPRRRSRSRSVGRREVDARHEAAVAPARAMPAAAALEHDDVRVGLGGEHVPGGPEARCSRRRRRRRPRGDRPRARAAPRGCPRRRSRSRARRAASGHVDARSRPRRRRARPRAAPAARRRRRGRARSSARRRRGPRGSRGWPAAGGAASSRPRASPRAARRTARRRRRRRGRPARGTPAR